MTEEEAIGFALAELSKPGDVRDTKATHVEDASGEWLVFLEMCNGSRLYYMVQSNGTAKLDRMLVDLAPPAFDRGSGGRFLLWLVLNVGTFLIIVFFVIRLILQVYRG